MQEHPEWSDQWWAIFFKPELDKKGKSSPHIFHFIITGANLTYSRDRYVEDSNLRFLISPKEIDKLLADIQCIWGPGPQSMKFGSWWYFLL